MALVLQNPSGVPFGQFDGYTGETTNFKGGEVCTWAALPYPATGAADVNNDGYVNEGGLGKAVPAVSRALLTASSRPLFLSDDGTTNYGTLFGAVVGGSVGTQVNGPGVYTGAVLGPHTATGSGKITVWGTPGLYGITLDAVDIAADGLVPTNTALRVGTGLTFGTTVAGAGLLTPLGSTLAGASGSNTTTVARLASFETNGSLVSTPGSLVAALNSPSSDVTSLKQTTFYMAIVYYNGSGAGA